MGRMCAYRKSKIGIIQKATNMELKGKLKRISNLLYRFARHVRNTEKVPALEWGVEGCDLLAELRELDPKVYDKRVK